MGKFIEIVTSLHESTTRDCLARMNDDKVHCMKIARQFERDYWDGDRRYGYGGYRFIPGHWASVAQKLIDTYQLTNESSVLDVGCGKAFLLYEMKQILPDLHISGFDISRHGIEEAKKEIKPYLFVQGAQEDYPFQDSEFDLVISLGSLHNLHIFNLKKALIEIERVGKQGFVMVESYRNERELFNLQCWALTAEAFFHFDEWCWLFKEYGYSGDFEFIYF
tara:strand:+ start:76 stop:738 length:663 start_codon:yes stop_codon:yes gene_type:complete